MRILCTLCALLLLSPALSKAEEASQQQAQPLMIGAVEKYPLNAIGVNVLREAYGALQHTFLLSEWPSPRSLELANMGRLDGELGRIAGIEKNYPNMVRIPVPLITLDIVAVTANEALQNTPLTQLAQYHLGISRGLRLYDQVDVPLDNAEQPGTTDQLLRMLLSERIEIALIPRTIAGQWQKSVNRPLYILPEPLASFRIYHYLNRSHSDMVAPLTSVLQTMEKNGRLQGIKETYLNSFSH